jgi:hypothetical protein
MAKVSNAPLHSVERPKIVTGIVGAEFVVTVKICAVELPHTLLAVTETVPPVAPAVAIMLVPVEVPVHPPGNDQVYDVAPLTAEIEKVSLAFAQTIAVPLIAPGVAGTEVVIFTAKVCAVEFPQVLLAVTDTVPLVELVVAIMLLVADVPVHPPGSDHVYEVAPLTEDTEKVSKPPLQTFVVPLIAPGVPGAVLTVNDPLLVTEVHGVVTTIFPVPLAPAGSGTVTWPEFIKVTGVAATPLMVTDVVPEVKLEPLMVIVDPLPLHALVGEKLVIVGAEQELVVVPLMTTLPM